ncbi:type II secretion system protein GspD [Vandammella animalimorsus]|uniref:Type II secretion system protein GspD n=2 Tax=Vandammella animalimorsus TaxID=2029117 RepID=A0A2A2AC92_9BURK|nr:type II secretion system protein GspD [Vandammella animalimorsus]
MDPIAFDRRRLRAMPMSRLTSAPRPQGPGRQPLTARWVWTCLAVAASQFACSHLPPQADNATGQTSASASASATTVQANSEEVQAWQGTTMAVSGEAPRPNPRIEGRAANGQDDGPPEPQIRIYEGEGVTLNPPKRAVALTGEAGEFNFEEAPITEVVHVMMGEILKADYVLHQPIGGTLTLSTRKAVSKDTAMSLLETALLANGLLIAQDSRGFYHIGPPEALRGIVPAPRMAGTGYGPLPPGYGIVLLPLEYIGAAEMAEILKPVMGDSSLLRVDTIRNLLVLAGTRPQAEGWMELARTFDVNLLKGMSVGIFPLKYASVSDVQAAMQVLAGETPGGSGATATAPGQQNLSPQQRAAQLRAQQQAAQGRQAQPGGQQPQAATPIAAQVLPVLGSLRIVPLERLNSIMVITPRAQYLEQVKTWIGRLDQPNDSVEPQLFVYGVKNGSAAHLAQVLGGIFGGTPSAGGAVANSGVAPGLSQASTQTTGFANANTNSRFGAGAGLGGNNRLSAGGLGSNQPVVNTAPVAMDLGAARVIADPLNNAILVWGTRQEYEKIEATLKRLDKQPVQVLLEASIIEVTLTKELEYGLRWAFNGNLGDGFRGTGGSPTLQGITPPTDNALDIGRFAAGGTGHAFTYALTRGNRVNALLQMLAKRNLAKMLSSPSLLVLDNHTASILVGDQIPIATSSLTTPSGTNNTQNVSRTYQYRDTGVSLQVTPSVNAGDIVTLDVNQEVTNLLSAGSGDDTNPSFVQRQISSKVAVRSGEPIVLGGLIRENTRNGNDGIPGLVDIPVARHAFGSTNQRNERTELLVIITPTVIRSSDELRDAGNELRDRMQDLLRTRVEEIKRGGPVLPGEEDLADLVKPLTQTTLPPAAELPATGQNSARPANP